MDRLRFTLGLLFALFWIPAASFAGVAKVEICHKGSPITVGAPAVAAHVANHGDYVVGEEVCDDADNDCDGEVDEGDVCDAVCTEFTSCEAGTLVECGDGFSFCFVVLTIEGECFCSGDFGCGSTPPCVTSADCLDGFVCQGEGSGCCGAGVCVPPCAVDGLTAQSTATAGATNGAR